MTSMLDDGIYPDVAREQYDSIDRSNFSLLKLMKWSPAHYKHALVTPVPDSDAKKVGRVVHLAAFEPERFRNAIAVWDGGTRRGKDWDAFKERNQGKELLTENEYARCMSVQKAVQSHATAMRYVQRGQGEVSMLWTTKVGEAVVKAKGRIDFNSASAIVDLKTTRDASPDAFGRQAHDLSYVAQAAWYCDGYEAATGVKKPYVIIAVESEAPFVVQPYIVPEGLIELGREEYRGWLDKLLFCRSQYYWPGYSDGSELELSLPPWALPKEDEDLSGEGLILGSAR